MLTNPNLTNHSPATCILAANENVARIDDLVILHGIYALAERRGDRDAWVRVLGVQITACVSRLPWVERVALAAAWTGVTRDRSRRSRLAAMFARWCRDGVVEDRVASLLHRVRTPAAVAPLAA